MFTGRGSCGKRLLLPSIPSGCELIIWQKSACNLNGFCFFKKVVIPLQTFSFFYSIYRFLVSLITNAMNYFAGSLIDEFRKFHENHLMRDCALHCVGVIFTSEALWIFSVAPYIINPLTVLAVFRPFLLCS